MVEAVARRCRDLIEAQRLDVRAGTADALPWPPASFDAVFAVHTIYFWADAEKELAEIRRVLRPHGRLLLGFRESSPKAVAALPTSVYVWRSADEIRGLAAAAGFATDLLPGRSPGLWIRRAQPGGA
jgi:ubiquinone/menaquinone biosynthesis C-methylase UbiE